ncbi:MAG: Glu-tRNA(Gln) amidotransferase subunit GatD [Thaumarchaeota archaeon]|nr:Glu-tRNA(Gln) amidotransferase subunit GatD [Nitrososphaerota archaeon]
MDLTAHHMRELAGYSGRALRFLEEAKAGIGDVLQVETSWGPVSGTLVPRYSYGDDEHIVLKLKTGYNVGLAVGKLVSASVKARGEKPAFNVPQRPKKKPGLPRVLILGTGGTIASRVDYRTGAVRPAISAGELHSLIPELSAVADVETEIMFNVLSENIAPSHWSKLAVRVGRAVKQGFDGIVIMHGTDTMGYTAAALSFALVRVPCPVVLVGAQRSSDRPSSDAVFNLIGSVSFAAESPYSGVYVGMHLDESDERVALHRGTRVRKNHTSRRDAFVSVGVPIAAVWGPSGLEDADPGLPPRGKGPFKPRSKFDGRVALLKFYPSMPGRMIRAVKLLGAKALVLEGTGLGHVSSEDTAAVKEFVRKGGLAFITSQCIEGRVDLNVYDTGRDLLKAGVVPLEDMLSETALAKAMWALGNSATAKEAKEIMVEDLAGEMTSRRFPG